MLSEQPLPNRHQSEKTLELDSFSSSRKKSSITHKQLCELLWKLRHPLVPLTSKSTNTQGDLLFYRTRSGRLGTAAVYNKIGHQKTALILPNLGFNKHWYLSWKTPIFKTLTHLNYSLIFADQAPQVSSAAELLEEDLSALYGVLSDAKIATPSLILGAGYGALLAIKWMNMGARAEYLLALDVPKSPNDLFSDHDVPKSLNLNPIEELRFYFNAEEEQRRTLRHRGWIGVSKVYIKQLASSFRNNRFEIDHSTFSINKNTVCISNRPIHLNAPCLHIINAKHPHLYDNQEFTNKLSALIKTTAQNWVKHI